MNSNEWYRNCKLGHIHLFAFTFSFMSYVESPEFFLLKVSSLKYYSRIYSWRKYYVLALAVIPANFVKNTENNLINLRLMREKPQH